MSDSKKTNEPDPAVLRERASAFRVLDANANRATEGLRVVEEFLRFHWQDRLLSEMCKSIRHEVSRTVVGLMSIDNRTACRSTETDVGVQVQGEAEYSRPALIDVALANVKRATEALRVMEEYSKLFSADAAKQFESLRYRTYTLEKSIGHLVRGNQRLQDAHLYVLIDGSFGYGQEFQNRIQQLAKSEVDIVQLRAKDATDRQIVEVSREIGGMLQSAGILFVMNDRPDIARVVNADGVHVGQSELSVADARAIVGPEMLVGVSTRTLSQAKQAVVDGADYIGVGPVFPSETKQFDELAGLDFVKEVSGEIRLPFFAIGGIDESRLADLVAAGGFRAAISQAVWHAADPIATARRIKEELVRASPSLTDPELQSGN